MTNRTPSGLANSFVAVVSISRTVTGKLHTDVRPWLYLLGFNLYFFYFRKLQISVVEAPLKKR